MIGSAAYLAPERVEGRRATERSDLYAVGVVAYEALTGRRPFSGETPIALARAIHEGRPPRPRDFAPTFPATSPISSCARWRVTRPSVPRRRPSSRETSTPRCYLPSSVTSDGTRTATLPRVAPIEPKRQWSWRPLALLFAGCITLGLVGGTLWAAIRDDGGPPPAPSETTWIPSEPTVPESPAPARGRVRSPRRTGAAMRRVLLVAVVVAATLAACGDSERSITEDGAAFLSARVADAARPRPRATTHVRPACSRRSTPRSTTSCARKT